LAIFVFARGWGEVLISSIKESLREMGRRGLFGGDVDLSENGIGDEIIGLDIPG
jgi:hypothetical protein